jgi:hypothetical protein
MHAVLGGLILVPAIDQAFNAGLRRLLGSGAIAFLIGELRVVSAPLRSGEHMSTLWGAWIVVAVPLAALCTIVTPMSWPGGLVLGASLSHLIEMSRLAFAFSRALLASW